MPGREWERNFPSLTCVTPSEVLNALVLRMVLSCGLDFFLLYWQIKAANTKTTQRLEPAASRILRVFIFLIAVVLLSTTRIPLPWLYLQLWPVGLLPFWLGAAVTIAGLLFAVWGARAPWQKLEPLRDH